VTALWNSLAGTIASPLGLVLLLPLLAIVVLAIFWTARIVWWEYALVVAVPFVFVMGVRTISVDAQTHDVEWVRLHATEGWFEESWNRYVHRRCSTGGKRPRSYDCSYVETIPPRWWAKLSDGSVRNISNSAFQRLSNTWGGATFIEMHRPSFTKDGDAWKSVWKGDEATLQPWTIEQAWENRIHAARSVFGYSPVDTAVKRRLKLVDYPTGSGPDKPQVLGTSDSLADAMLRRRNARADSAGPNIFLIVFDGQGPAAGRAQEALWEGGNRNEFVVCLGRAKNRTTWVHIFSWTPDKKLVIEVRDLLEERDSLTLPQIADSLASRVIPRWKSRDFHEFDYLRIQPTPRAIVFASLLALATCLGIGWWVVRNDHSLRGEQPIRWIPRPKRFSRT